MDFSRYLIKTYDQWDLYLMENQYYLGRMYLWAKREGKIDMTEMTSEEHQEWWEISQEVRAALNKLFQPDLFNWSFLQNQESHGHHLHMHIIPRYKTKREFSGVTFTDGNWGRNPSPYPTDFKIPDELTWQIRDTIKEQIKKNPD